MSINKDLDEKEISYYARFPMALYEADKTGIVPKGYMIDRTLSKLDVKSEAVYVNVDKREVVWVLTGTRIKPLLETDKHEIVDLIQDAFISIGGLTGYFGSFGLQSVQRSLKGDLLFGFKRLYDKYYRDQRQPYRLVMASHSLGASQQQLLMLQLIENDSIKELGIGPLREQLGLQDYQKFIKDVYGFNLGLSPVDAFKFYSGLHYVSKEDREYWEAHNHLVIIEGDIISSRIADAETFDNALPQHVQVLQRKQQFKDNPHTILNFFTDTDLGEIENIVSSNVITLSEMPPTPRPIESIEDIKRRGEEFTQRTEALGRRMQSDFANIASQVGRALGKGESRSSSLGQYKSVTGVQPPNRPPGVNRGFKPLTSVSEVSNRKYITTKGSSGRPYSVSIGAQPEPTVFGLNYENRAASRNPQSGITPGGSSSARAGAAALTPSEAASLNGHSMTGTTAGRIGAWVLGSSKYGYGSITPSLSASQRPPIPEITTTESVLNRHYNVKGLQNVQIGDTNKYRQLFTDPYRIQKEIEKSINIETPGKIKRAPILKRERVIKTDPFTGEAIETYVTTAEYRGGAEGLIGLNPTQEDIPQAVVKPLINEKPRVEKSRKLRPNPTVADIHASKGNGVSVKKLGLKPDKKYKL